MVDDPRKIATRIKHEIIKEYLQAWGGIIVHGLRSYFSDPNFMTHFVYVDCFSFTSKYTSGKSVAYGSAVIGIQELDKLQNWVLETYSYRLTRNAILVEENAEYFEQLLDTLTELGYEDRIVVNPADLNALSDGQIALFQSDYRMQINKILHFTSHYVWSFYLLDPYGPRGIDLQSVSKVIRQKRTDSIIYFPYLDLQRKTGLLLKPEVTLRKANNKQLIQYDKLFGSTDWRQLTVDEHEKQKDVMDMLILYYRNVLRGVDSDLAVKHIPLKFDSKQRTKYVLYLTTHDGTGALRMNEILGNATIREFDYRTEQRIAKQVPPTQMSMFTLEETKNDHPDRPAVPEVDIQVLSNRMINVFKGRNITLRDIYKEMADMAYFVDDIRETLKELKKNNRITFTGSLRNKTKIHF